MDAEFFDRRPELWKGVQLAFVFAPIEVVLPVAAQLLQIVEAGSIVPRWYSHRGRPPRAGEPASQVVELVLRDVD